MLILSRRTVQIIRIPSKTHFYMANKAKKIVSAAAARRKKAVVKAKAAQKAQGKPIGAVTHFYGNIKVAIVRFKKPISVGSVIAFRGNKTDFEHKISSMQFDHEAIKKAPKGKQVGIKVGKRVREGDEVFEA